MNAAAAALMTRIETITVTEAQIVAQGDERDRDRLRNAARVEAWECGHGQEWSTAWDAAFKAGTAPAVAASIARRESGQWTSSEPVASDPTWIALWSAAWSNMADAVAAAAVRHLLSATDYAALTRPLRNAIGPELPGEGGAADDEPAPLP